MFQIPNLLSLKHFPVPCSLKFFDVITSLNNSKCVDTHVLDNIILKETCNIIIKLFKELVNLIFPTGLFPEVFKYHKVLPVFCLEN